MTIALAHCRCFMVLFAMMFLLTLPIFPQSSRNTLIHLLKIGPVDVDQRQRVTLESGSADLMGVAEEYQGKTFQALVQPLGQSQWVAGPWSASEPGSSFQIPGVSFPAAECRLVVLVFDHEAQYRLGALVDEGEWRQRAIARSQIVTVRTATSEAIRTAKAPPLAAATRTIRVVSIDGANVGEGMEPVIRPSADVLVEADQGSKPYLYVNIPGTNRCFAYGPGAPDTEPDRFLFRNVPFSFPGIPEQLHARVFVIITNASMQTGEVTCGNALDQSLPGSKTVDVVIGPKNRYVTPDRIASLIITAVGEQAIAKGGVITVHDGDAVVVRQRGIPEGSSPVVLIRRLGDYLWLPAGQMIERALPRAGGPAAVEWVLPTTRFMAPSPDVGESTEFEIVVALTNSPLPCLWLDGAFLSNHSIVEGVSEPVRVRVAEPAQPFKVELSIVKVGDQRLFNSGSVEVDHEGPIEIEAQGNVSQPFFVYAVIERNSRPDVQLIEAMRSGKSFFVPQWAGGDQGRNQRFTITAFSSLAPMASRTMNYPQLLPHIAYASEPKTILLLAKPTDQSDKAGLSLLGPNRGWLMELLLGVAVILCLGVLALFMYERYIGGLSDLAGMVANRLKKWLTSINGRFETPAKINLGRFLLGAGVCALLVWAISQWYVWTYAEVIAEVTGLTSSKALNLGVYFLISLGILGILLEQLRNASFSVRTFLWIAIVVLFAFQGLLYFSYFYHRGGALAPLGFLAGFMVPVVDALGMYFVSYCVTDSIGYFVVKLFLAPFVLLEVALSVVQHAFDPNRPRKGRRAGPRPSEAPGDWS